MQKKLAVIEVTDKNRILISIFKADISDIASFGWTKAKDASEFEEFSGETPTTTLRQTTDLDDENWIESTLSNLSNKPDYYILIGEDRAPKKVKSSNNLIPALVFVGRRKQITVGDTSIWFTQKEISALSGKSPQKRKYQPLGYMSTLPRIPIKILSEIYSLERATPIATLSRAFTAEHYIEKIKSIGGSQEGFVLVILTNEYTEIRYERF